MNLKLIRDREHSPDGCTFGRLYVDGKPFCWTIEDEERDEKVYGRTAIPTGKYQVVVTRSVRFKRDLPLLLAVPNFSGVRIHPGNTAADTEGCILPGDAPDYDNRFLGQSRAAFNRLFPLIVEALAAKKEVWIEIL